MENESDPEERAPRTPHVPLVWTGLALSAAALFATRLEALRRLPGGAVSGDALTMLGRAGLLAGGLLIVVGALLASRER